MVPDIYMDNITDRIFQIVIYFIQQQHDQISAIYVSTYRSLLPLINIHQFKIKIQHFRLANPDYNNISIENHKQEILQIFMLALCVFITC